MRNLSCPAVSHWNEKKKKLLIGEQRLIVKSEEVEYYIYIVCVCVCMCTCLRVCV